MSLSADRLLQRAEELRLGIGGEEIEVLVENRGVEEAGGGLERLGEWLAEANAQNQDGVTLTPAIVEYLAGGEEISRLIENLEELREATRRGGFDMGNLLQKELEYKRFESEARRQRDWAKEPEEQRVVFEGLEWLGEMEEEGAYVLSERDRREAKRAAFEANLFYEFLMEFKGQTEREIVVVGNERYGRQWVVEPLEEYLEGEFEIRYFRTPSHGSMRLTVPHYLERFQHNGFTPEFAVQLSRQMPHVVIVDECSPRQTETYSKFARGVRDLVNWFMVFNDLRAEGDGSKYEEESGLPTYHFPELKKWYEYVQVRRKMKPWIEPGEVYAVSHWAPELKDEVIMGGMVIPSKRPDLGSVMAQVVVANPAIYRTQGENLAPILKETEPYYFNDPEKMVKEELVPGFGAHGFEVRVEGATTDDYVAAVQRQIRLEIEVLMKGRG